MQVYLVDFENVQPTDLGALVPGGNSIKVFVGASQSKVLLELAQALQRFGTDGEYIQISGSGPNAVDFHIAFYIGQLAAAHPEARFAIVSKDTGFDPLIKHLATLGIACRRITTFAGTTAATTSAVPKAAPVAMKKAVVAKAKPKPKPAKNVTVIVSPATPTTPKSVTAATSGPARVTEVIKRLKGLKAAKPGKLKTLESSVTSWFKPALDAKALAAVIQSLTDSKKIKIDGAKVTYALG